MSNFTEMDCYLFGQATHYDIYRKMGAHKMTIEGEEGVCFDVWAPHADRVYVIGEFNGWNETSHEMKRVTPETMGVYELFVPGVQLGCMYKFRAGWKKAVQSRSLCKLCTAAAGDHFHCHRYFQFSLVRYGMDECQKKTFQRGSI